MPKVTPTLLIVVAMLTPLPAFPQGWGWGLRRRIGRRCFSRRCGQRIHGWWRHAVGSPNAGSAGAGTAGVSGVPSGLAG